MKDCENEKRYVSIWGNAISIADRRPENYARDLTLRYPIHPAFDGDKIKITLDNFCGTEPVTVTEVYVASNTSQGSREILKDSTAAVTFGGRTSVTIPGGGSVVSDEIPFKVKRGNDISVSMYFADFTLMRSAVLITGPLSKGFYSVGNHASSPELPVDYTRNTNWFYFLSNVEVYTDSINRAIVCFGDSITAQSWPDDLTLRNEREGINKRGNRKVLTCTDV